jgi:hypothetical protein
MLPSRCHGRQVDRPNCKLKGFRHLCRVVEGSQYFGGRGGVWHHHRNVPIPRRHRKPPMGSITKNSLNRSMPQRGIAYQPGATLRVARGRQECVLKERRISAACHSAFDGMWRPYRTREWPGSEFPGLLPGLVCGRPVGAKEMSRRREMQGHSRCAPSENSPKSNDQAVQ